MYCSIIQCNNSVTHCWGLFHYFTIDSCWLYVRVYRYNLLYKLVISMTYGLRLQPLYYLWELTWWSRKMRLISRFFICSSLSVERWKFSSRSTGEWTHLFYRYNVSLCNFAHKIQILLKTGRSIIMLHTISDRVIVHQHHTRDIVDSRWHSFESQSLLTELVSTLKCTVSDRPGGGFRTPLHTPFLHKPRTHRDVQATELLLGQGAAQHVPRESPHRGLDVDVVLELLICDWHEARVKCI